MPDYLVRWEIDAEGFDSPAEAAAWARGLQRKPDAIVGVFDVTPRDGGETVRVDLDFDEDEDRCSYSTVYGGEQWCDTHDSAAPCVVGRG